MRNKHSKNLKKRYHYDIEKVDNKKLLKKIRVQYVENIFELAMNDYNDKHVGFVNENYDSDTLYRLVLNYIRHTLTNYDKIVQSTFYDCDKELKRMINRKIINRYEYEFKEIRECKLKSIMRDCTD